MYSTNKFDWQYNNWEVELILSQVLLLQPIGLQNKICSAICGLRESKSEPASTALIQEWPLMKAHVINYLCHAIILTSHVLMLLGKILSGRFHPDAAMVAINPRDWHIGSVRNQLLILSETFLKVNIDNHFHHQKHLFD